MEFIFAMPSTNLHFLLALNLRKGSNTGDIHCLNYFSRTSKWTAGQYWGALGK